MIRKTMIKFLAVISAAAVICSFIGGQAAVASFPAASDETEMENSAELPQNGIPLVIIHIDESEEAIADANENDPKHEYGTVEQMDESERHTVRCIGDLQVIVPDGFEAEYGSVEVPSDPVEMKYIRGRGNMSWGMSHKKSYKVEFPDAQDFFGMGASTDWALMSNSMDSSFLRNRITYWLGDQTGLDFQVRQVPVDVVMIGSESGRKYLGSYTLCETVSIDQDRISIPKLKKDTESEDPGEIPNITGGYLLSYYSKTQDSDKPKNAVFTTDSGLQWMCRSPEFEDGDLTEGQSRQRSYIQSFMQELDDLIVGSETIGEETHQQIAEMMDMNSAADYWWIQTFSYNPDAFRTSSTYMYKTPDTASEKGKLYWGPLWDFDGAYFFGSETELGARTGLNNTEDIWFDQLRDKDPLFVELLRERWQDPENGMNVKLMEITREGGLLDRYRDEIRASWEANEQELFADLDPEYAADLDELAGQIRKWIDVRREWVNDNLDALDQVFFQVTYMVDGEVYTSDIVRGSTNILINDMPEAPEKDGYVFIGWKEEESGEPILGYFINTNTVFVAEYEDRSQVTEPEEILFGLDEDKVSLDAGFYWIQYQIIPEDALTGIIKWTSSDTDVATADTEFVELVGTGDVTITATLWNGVSNSITLHITEPEAAMTDE